jgi:hypothetical protein
MNEIVERLKTELPYLNDEVYPIHERTEAFKFKGRKDPFILVIYSGANILDRHGYEDQDHIFIIFVFKHGWDKEGAGTYTVTATGDKTIADIVNEAKLKLDLYMFDTELPNYCYHAAAQSFNPTTSTIQLGIPDQFYNNSGGFRMLYQVEER